MLWNVDAGGLKSPGTVAREMCLRNSAATSIEGGNHEIHYDGRALVHEHDVRAYGQAVRAIGGDIAPAGQTAGAPFLYGNRRAHARAGACVEGAWHQTGRLRRHALLEPQCASRMLLRHSARWSGDAHAQFAPLRGRDRL